MDSNMKKEIALRDKAFDSLLEEVKAKDELIRAQNDMIRLLEENNDELKKLMERILLSLEKG